MKYLLSALVALVALVISPAILAAPTCVVGAAGQAPVVTLTFTAPTLNTDGTPVATPLTYNLYMSTSSGTEVKTATGLTGSPVSVTANLKPATTYFFTLTAVDKNGVESAQTNEVCKSFPASVPSTFTITIT